MHDVRIRYQDDDQVTHWSVDDDVMVRLQRQIIGSLTHQLGMLQLDLAHNRAGAQAADEEDE
jgi:hypothetical protein